MDSYEERVVKLRLRGNSIRLRLGQSEVRRLNASETLTETLEFGPGLAAFSYTLTSVPTPASPTATFADGQLSVTLSSDAVRTWAASDDVGIRATQPAGAGQTLSLLIEKDFECIDNESGELQDDAFPNPHPTCA